MALDPSSFSLVLTAGVMALLSPCGFPMLPGYVSYYLGSNVSLEKAVSGGVVCTLGLLTVFSAIGVVVSTVGTVVSRYIPLLEVVAGTIMILLGVGTMFEIRIPFFLPIPRAPKQKGLVGIFLYGVIYGLATIGCSAPIFLSILFYAFVGGGLHYGLLIFVAYAIGMGFPIILITLLVAKAKKIMLERIVRMMPWFRKISGTILVLIGVYLIFFYVRSLLL